MNNIKCIILDIDGTLINSKNKVTKFTRNVIKNIVKNDIMVILASGRSTQYVVETSQKCSSSKIIISNNGSIIYDYKNNKYLYINKFTKNKLKQIWNICLKYNIDSIYNANDIRYRKYICLDKSFNEKNDLVIENYEEIEKNIHQVVLLGKKDTDFKLCLNKIKKIDLIINNSAKGSNGISFADVNCNDVSKGTAIKKICKLFKIKKQEILCIGDSINDIELFENCGVKVAMKNSVEELKSKADYITEYTNEENGAAIFLQKYITK